MYPLVGKYKRRSTTQIMFKDLPSRIRTIYHKAKLSYSLVNQIEIDNPKVPASLPPAVYDVPPAVYEELVAFKEKRGLQSVEVAVTAILAEYFEQLQPSLNPATDTTNSRLESLEAKCTRLSETVAELQAAIATLQARSHLLNDNGSADLSAVSSPQLDQRQIVEPTTEISHVNFSKSLDQMVDHSVQVSTSKQPNPANLSDSLSITLDDSKAEDLVEEETVHAPLTQAALAKRLGVSTSSISRMQSKPNFPEWSQQKDPEGVAWARSPKTKEFHPQNNK